MKIWYFFVSSPPCFKNVPASVFWFYLLRIVFLFVVLYFLPFAMARERLKKYNVTNWHLYMTPERGTRFSPTTSNIEMKYNWTNVPLELNCSILCISNMDCVLVWNNVIMMNIGNVFYFQPSFISSLRCLHLPVLMAFGGDKIWDKQVLKTWFSYRMYLLIPRILKHCNYYMM